MLSYSNSSATGALAALSQSPLTIAGSSSGNNLGWVYFRPTAMDLTNLAGSVPNPVEYTASRTATVCYMRGLAENIRIETSSGSPWFHRRICFASRDTAFIFPGSNDPSGTDRSAVAQGAIETSNGWQRMAANMTLDTLTDTNTIHRKIIFKGEQGVDWDDFITAPLDTTRIDVKFDKTYVYKSGNERGIIRESKLWHPMNKNLVFDDDENGGSFNERNFSVTDKRGMGNYHIVDLFSQGSSGSTSDLLKIRYTSTLYWHER